MTLKEQENEIVKLAFMQEINKLAGLGTTVAPLLGKLFSGASKISSGNFAKYFSKASETFLKGGEMAFAEGAKYLKGFAKEKDFIKTTKGISQTIRNVSKKEDNFIARGIGTAVHGFSGYGEGVGAAKGFLRKSNKIIGNIAKNTSRDFRNASYKTWDPKSFTEVAYDKSGAPSKLITKFNRSRKIVGTASDGSFITKKRLLPKTLAWTFTPAGMGGMAYASAKTKKEGAKEGVRDFLAWKTPIGPLKLNYDMAKWGLNKLTN